MLSVTLTFVACWLAMVCAPRTATGLVLRRWLVDRPVAHLLRITRGQIAFAILVTTVGGLAVWAGGGDAVRMLGMATPDVLGWAAMFDVATYLDVTLALALAASTLKIRMVVTQLAPLQRIFRPMRPRASRARRVHRATLAAANDDGHAVAVAA